MGRIIFNQSWGVKDQECSREDPGYTIFSLKSNSKNSNTYMHISREDLPECEASNILLLFVFKNWLEIIQSVCRLQILVRQFAAKTWARRDGGAGGADFPVLQT